MHPDNNLVLVIHFEKNKRLLAKVKLNRIEHRYSLKMVFLKVKQFSSRKMKIKAFLVYKFYVHLSFCRNTILRHTLLKCLIRFW